MNLQSRLSLLLSSVVILVSVAIGAFALSQSYRQQLTLNDSKIENVILQLSRSQEDPLSLASFLADQSGFTFSLSLITEDLQSVTVSDGAGEITGALNSDFLERAKERPINLSDVRIRSFALDDSEYLVLSYSLSEIHKARDQNRLYLGIFIVLVVALVTGLSYILFKRDAELNKAASAIQDSQKRMMEFLGDAAHELRTPLTVIRGYFDLIKQGKGDEKKQDVYRGHVDTEIARMQNLIDKLLVVAELDSREKGEVSFSNISIALENAISQVEQLQPARTVTASIDSEVVAMINEEDLQRLLANIFSNIRRHTPSDSSVQVLCRRSGDLARIEITDSGPGLPDDFYLNGARAFQRFDSARSRESGGSGLGMSIIQKVVDKSGGRLKLSPGVTGGLKIVIELPSFKK